MVASLKAGCALEPDSRGVPWIFKKNVAQRFRRWLKNEQVDVRALYDPVALATGRVATYPTAHPD